MGEEGQEYKIVFAALPGYKWLEHPVSFVCLFIFNIMSGHKIHEHILGLMEVK